MPLIQWNDSYQLNIPSIDRQHKKLASIVNEFHDAVINKKSKNAMDKLFIELINYTDTHFKYEEKYFEKFDYVGTDRHKKIHMDLLNKVAELKKRYDSGKLVLSLEILNFLKDWIKNHIKIDDKKYAKHFIENGLR